MSHQPRLETRHLALTAGGRTLVNDLTVQFDAGQNWAILGANGSGKTTLLHALAGLRPADHGRILLDGTDLQAVPRRDRARQLGVLFQEHGSALTARVRDTVLTGRHPHLGRWQSEGPDDIALAEAALAATDLSGLARRFTDTLSGGERRRMELATLLTQDAPISLLDEPVNHLDPHYQIGLLGLVCGRARRSGHLNLIVLHDVNLALRFCSHGLLLLPGGDTRHGKLEEIVDSTVLQQLYGCAMREIRDDRQRLYLPA